MKKIYFYVTIDLVVGFRKLLMPHKYIFPFHVSFLFPKKNFNSANVCFLQLYNKQNKLNFPVAGVSEFERNNSHFQSR
jgi:hypothetical protein